MTKITSKDLELGENDFGKIDINNPDPNTEGFAPAVKRGIPVEYLNAFKGPTTEQKKLGAQAKPFTEEKLKEAIAAFQKGIEKQ